MIPVLIHFGFVKIYTMGVFLVLAFLAAAFVFWKNLKLTSYKEEEIFDGLFISILGGLFGARLVYVLLNFDQFGFSILRFLLINGYPGLSIFGALVGSFITMVIFARPRKISVLDLAEYIVSPLFLALSISKVGSFLSGADIGVVTKLPLAVRYAGVDGMRHIVALYESAFFIIGYLVTHRILFMVRRDRAKEGTSLILFILYFGLVQLIVDNLKQNHLYLAGLSFNMMAGAVFFTVGTVFLLTTYRQNIVYITKHLFNRTHKYGTRTPNQSTAGRAQTDSA